MFRNLLVETCKKSLTNFGLSNVQTRNTFVLKRRYPINLHKIGKKPPKLRARQFVYDTVEFSLAKPKPDIEVILTEYVRGLGYRGDRVKLRPQKAYNEFLLTGRGVYPTPGNVMKFPPIDKSNVTEKTFSSPYVEKTMSLLSKYNLQITMSKTQPWVLEPWHISANFRKGGYVVPEDAIIMPLGEISGPDLTLQDKEFYITVIINQKEKVDVRCTIHHWAMGAERLPWVEFHWKKKLEPLFPEQAEVLENMFRKT